MAGRAFWTTKPPPGVKVDPGHPLAPTAAWLFNEGAGEPMEAVAQIALPPGRLIPDLTTFWKAGKYGPELSFPGDNFVGYGQLQRTIPTRLWATVAAIVTPSTVAAGAAYIISIGRAGESGVSFGRSAAALRLTKNGVVDVDSSGITLTAGDTWFVAAQVDGAGVRFYARNLTSGGVQVGTTANTSAFDVNPFPSSVRLGGTQTNVGVNTIFWLGEISCVFAWNDRRLTNEQVDSLATDPFQMFAPPAWRRHFVASAGGGTDVTVAPSLLTATLTLHAPTVSATRNVTASPSLLTMTTTLHAPTVTAGADVTVTPSLLSMALTLYEPFTETYQIARPIADVSVGNWTKHDDGTTDLYATLDETTADDDDFVQSSESPAAWDEYKQRLEPMVDPNSAEGHTLRFRYQKDSGTDRIDLMVSLYRADGATLITQVGFADIGTDLLDGAIVLSAANADDIPTDDYAIGLVVGFAAIENTGVGGGVPPWI